MPINIYKIKELDLCFILLFVFLPKTKLDALERLKKQAAKKAIQV